MAADGGRSLVTAVAQRWPIRTLEERFMEKVVIDETTGCWVWQAAFTTGYAWFNVDGTPQLGHRVAYEMLVGPIPEWLTLDHLCRNRACVNPEHLEPVTLAENKRRGESPAAINARKTHCPQGHPYDEENTHVTTEGYRDCRTCARERHRQIAAADRAAREPCVCARPGCTNLIPVTARRDKVACSNACRLRLNRARRAAA